MSEWFQSSSSLFQKGVSEAVLRGCECKAKDGAVPGEIFRQSGWFLHQAHCFSRSGPQQRWRAGVVGDTRAAERRGEEEKTILEMQLICEGPPKIQRWSLT